VQPNIDTVSCKCTRVSSDLHPSPTRRSSDLTKVPESSPSIFEFYRYTSPGTRLYSADLQKAPPAYFSLDGGQTKLADYGQTSDRSEEHTSELQSHLNLVCSLLLEKK